MRFIVLLFIGTKQNSRYTGINDRMREPENSLAEPADALFEDTGEMPSSVLVLRVAVPAQNAEGNPNSKRNRS